jgi:hypothetical protein
MRVACEKIILLKHSKTLQILSITRSSKLSSHKYNLMKLNENLSNNIFRKIKKEITFRKLLSTLEINILDNKQSSRDFT